MTGGNPNSNQVTIPWGYTSKDPPHHPYGWANVPRSPKLDRPLNYHHAKDEEIHRIIKILLHPPNQPTTLTGPKVAVIHLDWARRIIGNQHFDARPQESEEDCCSFYPRGLKKKVHGRKGNPKTALWYRGLEFGLPLQYWMALCGWRKEECDGDVLILSVDEWKDGAEKRVKKGLVAMFL